MAIYKNPIHGRLNDIVRNAKGYNFEYHINKIAEECSLPYEEVRAVFLMTGNNDLRETYIKMLREGKDFEYIRRIHKIRFRRVESEFNEVFKLLNNSPYGRTFQ